MSYGFHCIYRHTYITCYYSLYGSFKVLQLNVGRKISRCDERRLVANIGHVGSGEAWCLGGHLTGQLLNVLQCLDGLEMHLEYGCSEEQVKKLNDKNNGVTIQASFIILTKQCLLYSR